MHGSLLQSQGPGLGLQEYQQHQEKTRFFDIGSHSGSVPFSANKAPVCKGEDGERSW